MLLGTARARQATAKLSVPASCRRRVPELCVALLMSVSPPRRRRADRRAARPVR
jgi:hypothetical protein